MTRPSSKPAVPSLSKDFEYLIHREVDRGDNEHGMSTLQRNSRYQLRRIQLDN